MPKQFMGELESFKSDMELNNEELAPYSWLSFFSFANSSFFSFSSYQKIEIENESLNK